MRALVTGGAGFVGSHLVDALVARGDDVTYVDALVGGTVHHNPGATFVHADILNWPHSLIGFDAVFHLAASKATVCMADPERDLRTNALGTLRLATMAARAGATFVHASTGSVAAAASYYAISKGAGEQYVRLVGELEGMPWTALRYYHVIGARQSDDQDIGGVVPIFLRRASLGLALMVHGTGAQVRSFTSVHDVVRATLLVADKPQRAVLDCASGIRVSIRELAEFIAADHGLAILSGPRRPWDVDEFFPNSDRLRELGIDFDTDWRRLIRAMGVGQVAA